MSKWIGDSGNTSNAAEWDAGVPDSTHDAIFDAGSFSTTGLTTTVDATLSCLNMDWTGALYNPTLANPVSQLRIYGNTILINSLIMSGSGSLRFYSTSTQTLTTNGCVTLGIITQGTGGILSLQDDLTILPLMGIDIRIGGINTNNHNITCADFSKSDSGTHGAAAITLGSSTINCSSVNLSGTEITLNAGTSTFNCSGNFIGANKTFNIVNLTGATSTVTGDNTIKELGLNPIGTQTVTNTGYTQMLDALKRAGSGLITFVGGAYRKSGGGQLNRIGGSVYRHNQFKTPFCPSFLYKGY